MNLQESIRNDLNKINENTTLPKGVVKVNDASIALSGTSLINIFSFDYSTIVNTFGYPDEGDGYKTDAEWSIELDNGDVVTIYNYKDGKNYNDHDGLEVEEITNWHFGGNNEGSHFGRGSHEGVKRVVQILNGDTVTEGEHDKNIDFDARKEFYEQFYKTYSEFNKLRDTWIQDKHSKLNFINNINDEIYKIDSLMSDIGNKLNAHGVVDNDDDPWL
jgi:hypothetical protein